MSVLHSQHKPIRFLNNWDHLIILHNYIWCSHFQADWILSIHGTLVCLIILKRISPSFLLCAYGTQFYLFKHSVVQYFIFWSEVKQVGIWLSALPFSHQFCFSERQCGTQQHFHSFYTKEKLDSNSQFCYLYHCSADFVG